MRQSLYGFYLANEIKENFESLLTEQPCLGFPAPECETNSLMVLMVATGLKKSLSSVYGATADLPAEMTNVRNCYISSIENPASSLGFFYLSLTRFNSGFLRCKHPSPFF
jgi:hypothetical protein